MRTYSRAERLKNQAGSKMYDERTVEPQGPSKLKEGVMVRDAVLQTWNGQSDEGYLGGSCTHAEAVELYKAYFASHPELNAEFEGELSPAETNTPSGRKYIWLPVMFPRGQLLQMLKGTKLKLEAEIRRLEGHITYYKIELRDREHVIDELRKVATDREARIRRLEEDATLDNTHILKLNEAQLRELTQNSAASYEGTGWGKEQQQAVGAFKDPRRDDAGNIRPDWQKRQQEAVDNFLGLKPKRWWQFWR